MRKIKRRDALKAFFLTGAVSLLDKKALADCITTSDIQGPFYIAGSPWTTKLANSGSAGTKVFITGTVYARDCKTPIPEAVVDVWHAGDDGDYHDKNYRGKIKSDASGTYAYETILPGKYLNGSQYRPRHYHYKVNAPGKPVLTTQVYFKGDTSIPGDPWASDPDAAERIIQLTTDTDGNFHGVVDVYLDVDANSVNLEEEQRGEINSRIRYITPNPLMDTGEIGWYASGNSQYCLKLYNLYGKEVNSFINNTRTPGKQTLRFSAKDKNGIGLSSGIYIFKLFENNKPVDAKRVYLGTR